MPSPSKRVVADKLAAFQNAAREFAALASQLHSRAGSARTTVEQARIIALLDRAKILERGLRDMSAALLSAKKIASNFGDASDMADNGIVRKVSNELLTGATKALHWFNEDARALNARLTAGTVASMEHPAITGLKRAAPLIAGLAILAVKKGVFHAALKKVISK